MKPYQLNIPTKIFWQGHMGKDVKRGGTVIRRKSHACDNRTFPDTDRIC